MRYRVKLFEFEAKTKGAKELPGFVATGRNADRAMAEVKNRLEGEGRTIKSINMSPGNCITTYIEAPKMEA